MLTYFTLAYHYIPTESDAAAWQKQQRVGEWSRPSAYTTAKKIFCNACVNCLKLVKITLYAWRLNWIIYSLWMMISKVVGWKRKFKKSWKNKFETTAALTNLCGFPERISAWWRYKEEVVEDTTHVVLIQEPPCSLHRERLSRVQNSLSAEWKFPNMQNNIGMREQYRFAHALVHILHDWSDIWMWAGLDYKFAS